MCIAKLELVKTVNVRLHGELLDKTRTRHAEEFSVWRETSDEKADGAINYVKGAKADSVQMSVEKNLMLDHYAERVRAVQILINANVQRKVTLTDVMAKVRELLERDHSVHKSYYSVEISNRAREVQRLTGLFVSKNLESQTMLGLEDKASRLRKVLSKANGDKDRLKAVDSSCSRCGRRFWS